MQDFYTIYDRRSRFLCRCRSDVEQPSALGDVISIPSESILRQFYLLARSRHGNTFQCFMLSHCFILQFYVFFYYAFYSGFMYRGLAVL